MLTQLTSKWDKYLPPDQMLLHRLAYPFGKKQTYLPTDLLMVSAQLRTAGIDAKIADHNLDIRIPKGYKHHGIGLFGSPYIPEARRLAAELQEAGGEVCIGGQIAQRLNPEQFQRLFPHSSQVQNSIDLQMFVARGLPEADTLSIAGELDRLAPVALDQYLRNEFALYIAQGCKFRCDFCAADKGRPEEYRNQEAIREDLRALSKAARERGIKKLRMYLSSLDLFQTPLELAKVLETAAQIQSEFGIRYDLRGLCGVKSFLQGIEKHDLAKLVREAGVTTIGFGIDGTKQEIWRSQHKPNTSLTEADAVLGKCSELGITPEILMIMGYGKDSGKSLMKNFFYTVSRAIKYGAVARPYIAKEFSPGNDGWKKGYEQQISQILSDPDLFLDIDYAMSASKLTHPDRSKRYMANAAYWSLVATLEPFGRNATYPLLPQGESRLWNYFANAVNKWMPFDK